MAEKKTHLYFEGKYNDRDIKITNDFKNLKSAMEFVSCFENEEEFQKYIKDTYEKKVSSIKLVKTTRQKDDSIIKEEQPLLYGELTKYYTRNNICTIFNFKATDNDFVMKLKHDPYFKNFGRVGESPVNYLRTNSKETDGRIRKELSNITEQYVNLKRKDMKNFLDTVIVRYDVNNRQINNDAVMIHLFNKFITVEEINKYKKSLQSRKIEFKEDMNSNFSEDLVSYQTIMDLANQEKEIGEDIISFKTNIKKEEKKEEERDDLYPDTKTFGDGNLDNPDYVEYDENEIELQSDYDEFFRRRREEELNPIKKEIEYINTLKCTLSDGRQVKVSWFSENEILLIVGNSSRIISLSTAFKHFEILKDKEMLEVLRDFAVRGKKEEKRGRAR